MEKIIRVGKRKNYPKERINKPIDRYFDGKGKIVEPKKSIQISKLGIQEGRKQEREKKK